MNRYTPVTPKRLRRRRTVLTGCAIVVGIAAIVGAFLLGRPSH